MGSEARDLPDAGTDGGLAWQRAPEGATLWWDAAHDTKADPSAPALVAVVNPLREGRRGLELLEAMMAYHRYKALGMLPWWARAFAPLRISVTTEGVARDEATLDTIALGFGSPEREVSVDGHLWHGPSPHDFSPPRTWRDRIGVALIFAGSAFILWHLAARWWWELRPQASALYAMGCVLVLQAAHAVWWHARQQRRRAAQRARLSVAPPRVVTR